eukprot:EG_transcript_22537
MASHVGYPREATPDERQCYYSTIDLGHSLEGNWSRKSNGCSATLWAAATAAAVTIAWLGAVQWGVVEQGVELRSTTLDVGLQQGHNGLEAGLEVNEAGAKQYYGAVVGQGAYGKWRTALKSNGGTVTQQVDYSRKEGNTAFKLSLKKAGNADWKWRAGTETVGDISFGGGGGAGRLKAVEPPRSALVQASGGKPVVVTAAVGLTEGDVKVDAGFKVENGDVRLRAGVQGGGKTNSWGLNVDTPSRNKKGSWRVTLNTGN